MNKLQVLILVFVLMKCIDGTIRLDEKYYWKQLDYEYPSEYARQQALDSGELEPENLLPLGIEHFREKLFVTVPRWRDGIPATLTYIDTDKTPSGSPKLIPYPSWSSNRFGDCKNGLQSVHRIKVDKCNRLWVFDAGHFGILSTKKQICPPAINVYDLDTNVRIRRYELNREDTREATLISNIAVDVGRNCDDTFAYLTDQLAFGMIAFSLEKNQSWRFDHTFFFPDPLKADYNIAGLNFHWPDGALSMALSEVKPDGYRTLFFSPLTSHREFNVSTRILRDKSRVADNYYDFNAMKERGPNSHIVSRVIDEYSGVMLFNLIDQNAIGCWHTSSPYSPENLDIVDYDDVNLIFPSDIKVDEKRDVWVLSNRMPVYLLSKLNYRDINFRIFSAPVDEMVKGTRCHPQFAKPVHTRFGYDYTRFKPALDAAPFATRTERPIPKAIVNDRHLGLGYEPQLSTNEFFRSTYPEWWTKSLWDRN